MAELMGRSDGLCRGSADRCTWSTSSTDCSARPGSSGATCRSRWATRSPPGSAGPTRSRSCSSATAPSRRGTSHESVNLAALWELPVILVCENNGFAEFTPRSAHTSIERVSDVGRAVRVRARDGRRQRCRRRCTRRSAVSSRRLAPGAGPMLLECLTHRRRGHYEGDQQQLPRCARRRTVAPARPDRGLQRRALARLADEPRSTSSRGRASRGRRGGRGRAREPVPGTGADRASSCTRHERRRDDIPGGDQRHAGAGDARRRAGDRAGRGRRRGRPLRRHGRARRGVRRRRGCSTLRSARARSAASRSAPRRPGCVR